MLAANYKAQHKIRMWWNAKHFSWLKEVAKNEKLEPQEMNGIRNLFCWEFVLWHDHFGTQCNF